MSEIRATTISDSAGTGPITLTKQVAPKAWGTCDESAASFHDSFGMSSFTDNGTGNYTYTFTNAFDGSRYCALGSTYASDGRVIGFSNEATTSIRLRRANSAGTATDGDSCAGFIGDLA